MGLDVRSYEYWRMCQEYPPLRGALWFWASDY